MVKELTDNDFWAEVERSKVPYIVDFWAIWSQSCAVVSQIIDDLARQFDGNYNFGKVNVDNEIKITNDCDIQNIPTVIIFNKGVEAGRIIGTVTRDVLLSKIEGAAAAGSGKIRKSPRKPSKEES